MSGDIHLLLSQWLMSWFINIIYRFRLNHIKDRPPLCVPRWLISYLSKTDTQPTHSLVSPLPLQYSPIMSPPPNTRPPIPFTARPFYLSHAHPSLHLCNNIALNLMPFYFFNNFTHYVLRSFNQFNWREALVIVQIWYTPHMNSPPSHTFSEFFLYWPTHVFHFSCFPQ